MPAAIKPVFAVPMSSQLVPDTGALNETLRRKLLAWEKNDAEQARERAGVGRHNLYESEFTLFRRDDPDIRRIAHICLSAVGDLVREINRYSVSEMQQLRIYEHSWYHVTRHGGYFHPHNHPMASWSGVYCVTPGTAPPDGPAGGILHFLEARTTAGMYLDPGNAWMSAPYRFGDLSIALEPGQLLLFPSYLHHEVTPFEGRDERITIAFNCWLRYADQAVDEPQIRGREQH